MGKNEQQEFLNDYGLPNEEAAIKEGENYTKRTSPDLDRILGKNASWRKKQEPASEKQLNYLQTLLKKHKMPIPSNLKTTPKNVVSDMINAEIAKDVKVKISRMFDEYDE